MNLMKTLNCVRHYGRRLGVTEALRIYWGLRARGGRLLELPIPDTRFSIWIRTGASDINVYEQVFLEKQYEHSTLDDLDATFIIDAGANVGLTSVFFALRFRGATVLAIEPDRRNYELLCQNVKAFRNVNPMRAALWWRNTDLTVLDEGCGEWGYQVREGDGTATSTVSGRTLDSILEEHACSLVDLVKMDIEGAEREVFSLGPVGWLGRVKVLDIELHDRFKAGCAHAVYSAATRYRFQKYQRGEIDILDFRKKE